MSDAIRNLLRLTLIVSAVLQLGVHSTSAQFINASGSVRSHAMGNAGVTMIDHRSYTENPASLALYAPARDVTMTVGPYTWSGEEMLGFSRWSLGAAVSLGKKRIMKESPLCFGVAYYLDRFNFGQFLLTEESSSEVIGTYEPYTLTHNLILSAGYDGPIRVGLGTGLKLVKDRLAVYGAGLDQSSGKASTFALDLGFLATVPVDLSASSDHMGVRSGWSLWPSFGVTYSNLFGEMDYLDYAPGDELPRNLRTGFSVEIRQQTHGFKDFSLLAAYEVLSINPDDNYDDFSYTQIGAEVGIIQMVYVRYGRMKESDVEDTQQTWGIGFSSRGLAEHLSGEQHKSGELPLRSFWTQVSLELSYARYTDDHVTLFSGTDLFEIGLVMLL